MIKPQMGSVGTPQLYEAQILRVTPYGDLDVRCMDGATLRGVRLTNLKGGQVPRQGQDCLVIGDGAKFFCISVLERRANEGDPLDEPLVEGSFQLQDVNELGMGVILRGGAGLGFTIDTGGLALSEWNAALGMFTEYLERRETLMPGFHAEVQHDGEVAWASYTWRQTIDLDAINRDFEYEDDPDIAAGGEVHLDVFKDGHAIAMDVRESGVEKLRLTIATDGSFELDLPGRMTLSFDGELRIEVDGKVKVTSSDKIVLESSEVFLGAEVGADKVALASKVDAAIAALRSTIEAHQHAYVVSGAPAVTTPTVPPSQIVGSIGATGAANTSAT